MATLLFYKKPVTLNRDHHKDLRVKPADEGFAFSAKTNSVPLAGVEFADSSREFPIVFTQGASDGLPFPLALLGLRQDENLLLGSDGRWDSYYVPAFVRRYPFVLQAKQDDGEFSVLIDEEYAGLNRETGEPLFTEDGQDAPLLTQTLQFLTNFQHEVTRTNVFMQKLQELELLIPRVIQVSPADGSVPFVLQGLSVVDEAKLLGLPDEQLLELARSGFLGWIYAHLLSLGHLSKLHQKLEQKLGQVAETA